MAFKHYILSFVLSPRSHRSVDGISLLLKPDNPCGPHVCLSFPNCHQYYQHHLNTQNHDDFKKVSQGCLKQDYNTSCSTPAPAVHMSVQTMNININFAKRVAGNGIINPQKKCFKCLLSLQCINRGHLAVVA